VKVTARTTALIHKAIDRVVAPIAGTNKPQTANSGPPPLPPRPGEKTNATQYPGPPPKPPRLLNRILISTDLLLSTLEQSATQLVEGSTDSLARGLGHK
jgi:spartin